ncbi:hypothetical protein ACFQQB_05040 [Nonomuraea rubra]|uniref:hypothetical protein n=1 Tax=Nonomuraea rubra TaxID=46180 RepID=UPI00360A417E
MSRSLSLVPGSGPASPMTSSSFSQKARQFGSLTSAVTPAGSGWRGVSERMACRPQSLRVSGNSPSGRSLRFMVKPATSASLDGIVTYQIGAGVPVPRWNVAGRRRPSESTASTDSQSSPAGPK